MQIPTEVFLTTGRSIEGGLFATRTGNRRINILIFHGYLPYSVLRIVVVLFTVCCTMYSTLESRSDVPKRRIEETTTHIKSDQLPDKIASDRYAFTERYISYYINNIVLFNITSSIFSQIAFLVVIIDPKSVFTCRRPYQKVNYSPNT